MPETNGEAPDNDNEPSDAKDFRKKLDEKIAKADKIAETEKDERDKIEGKRIREYLEEVVPDWNSMNPTRLYKYIQDMLKNAEEIRRFEIDLVWKRAVYVISLMVLFFTAFGGLFYFTYDTETKHEDVKEILLVFILALIAFANAFLSFCLAKMNVANHRWQENWEHHVDYLQAILGLNLMRVYLPKKTGYFTIRRTNILISIFIFAIWSLVTLACFLATIALLVPEFCFPQADPLGDGSATMILFLIAVFSVCCYCFFLLYFMRYLRKKAFLGLVIQTLRKK